jgi:hypothetical protein
LSTLTIFQLLLALACVGGIVWSKRGERGESADVAIGDELGIALLVVVLILDGAVLLVRHLR